MAEFDKTKLASRQEIKIPLNLEGWKKLTYDYPLGAYRGVARRVDGVATKLTTGLLSVVTLPLALIVRNGARAANNTSDWDSDKVWGGLARFAGGAGALAGIGFTGWKVYGFVSTFAGGGFLGAVAGGGSGIATAALMSVPAFTIGVLAVSTAIGVIASGLSAIPAIPNIYVGALRTWDRLRGIKYDEETVRQLEQGFEKDSLSDRYERKTYSQVSSGIHKISRTHREEIYVSLKKEFEPAVDKKQEKGAGKAVRISAAPQEPQGPA